MTINIENYSIEQDNISPIHFNVSKTVLVTDKESPNFGKERKQNLAYGLTLPGAVHYVILDKASTREQVVSLEEFVKKYEKAVQTLTEKINSNVSKS